MSGIRNGSFWRTLLSRGHREEEGQDLAEYGMLAALIVVVVIVAIAALGGVLASLWATITTAFAGLP